MPSLRWAPTMLQPNVDLDTGSVTFPSSAERTNSPTYGREPTIMGAKEGYQVKPGHINKIQVDALSCGHHQILRPPLAPDGT